MMKNTAEIESKIGIRNNGKWCYCRKQEKLYTESEVNVCCAEVQTTKLKFKYKQNDSNASKMIQMQFGP